jgi:hypothetical protein
VILFYLEFYKLFDYSKIFEKKLEIAVVSRLKTQKNLGYLGWVLGKYQIPRPKLKVPKIPKIQAQTQTQKSQK